MDQSGRRDRLESSLPIETSDRDETDEKFKARVGLVVWGEEKGAEDLEDVINQDHREVAPDDLCDRLEDRLLLAEHEVRDRVLEGGAQKVLLRLVHERDKVGQLGGRRRERVHQLDRDLVKGRIEQLVRRLALMLGKRDNLFSQRDRSAYLS